MSTNGTRKRANPAATTEAPSVAKRTKPDPAPGRGRKRAKVVSDESDYEERGSDAPTKLVPAKAKRAKRSKAAAKPAETMAAVARTLSTKVLVGAHVSAAGGRFPRSK
jgi:hypothetical protein